MELELAGGTPKNPVAIEGTSYPERKRNASGHEHEYPAVRLRMADPPTFSGRSIKELQTFDTEWRIRHEANGDIDPKEWPIRIRYTATYLKGAAATA